MEVTLVYDNTTYREGLLADWGFACYIEMENSPSILFDTGANSPVLLHNMKKLGIEPSAIDIIVISHGHWDHTGGLSELLKVNQTAKLYLPASFHLSIADNKVVKAKDGVEIIDKVFSTGELRGGEQSLAIKTDTDLVVITGCSHPGVGRILDAASAYGKPGILIGGLHGFREFDLLKDLHSVCACHCTKYQQEIKKLYPDKWINGGAGRVIKV